MKPIADSRTLRILLLIGCVAYAPRTVAAQTLDSSSDIAASPKPYAGLFRTESISPDDAEPATSIAPFAVVQAPADKPEPPKHTGFSALVRSTAADFNSFPRRRSTYVLLAIGGAAAALAHPADDRINEELQESSGLRRALKPGRYIGSTYVQTGAAVGMYLIGRYAVKSEGTRTNKLSHIGFDLLRAQIVASTLTYGLKLAVRRDRPTGECCSFPSGHASVTFATASVLERHFGYRGAWPTWVIAGYVATSRLTDNRHFASDVLFGAALGVASGWTVVGRHGRDQFALVPVPMRRGAGFALTWRPGSARDGN